MYETIDLEIHGAAATIRLNRPQTLNAWNAQLGDELLDAVRGVGADDRVRAVAVTGAGRAFSSGADLRDLHARPRTDEGHVDVHTTLTEVYNPLIMGLRTMPKPVVAAVNGLAVGIGCSLALACDVVVAARSASLMLSFARIGLAPDGGATALVAARAGGGRAMAMALHGERIAADEALRVGLVDEVIDDEAFEDEVGSLLHRLASGPTRSYAGSKRQLNAWLYAGLQQQLELEARIQQETAASGDFAEGVAAWTAKRHPDFQGR